MLKEGDMVICKKKRQSQHFIFQVGKGYKIVYVAGLDGYHIYFIEKMIAECAFVDNGSQMYEMGDYFYNNQEIRKEKLKKIENV
jgi:hypothetical protein